MDKISVVVPFYNVAAYLDQCLASIVNQSYPNLEIILVNDGSTDGSLKIGQRYQRAHSNVKIINTHQGGVSVARNAGVGVASGRYLTFVDADDFLANKDAIMTLYRALKHYQVKIVIGSFDEFDEKRGNFGLYNHDQRATVYPVNQWFSHEYDSQKNFSQCFATPWAKLFERQLFANVRFPVGQIGEDDLTIWRLYRLVSKVVFLDRAIYVYRNQRKDSITTVANPAQLFSLPAMEQRIAMDQVCDFPYEVETHYYPWRVIAHYNHALEVAELSNYKHAALTKQIIEKYNK